MNVLFSFFEPWLVFFSEDPVVLSVQAGLIAVVSVLIFLVFFTAKDIIARTHSFVLTLFSILLVALLPLLGFLLYILLRPSVTLRQRALEENIQTLVSRTKETSGKDSTHSKKQKKESKSEEESTT